MQLANLRILVSSVVGYIVAALFNSILVIVKEENMEFTNG